MDYLVRTHGHVPGNKKLEVVRQWDLDGDPQQANYIFKVTEDLDELAASFNSAIDHLSKCQVSCVVSK